MSDPNPAQPLNIQQLAHIERLGWKIFKPQLRNAYESSVWQPGSFGWSPTSLMVVITEWGYFPDPWSCGHDLHKLWAQWEQQISDFLGCQVFFESISSVVSALYLV